MSVFYGVLMEKVAEQNYHSRYLSEGARQKAFDQANKRRAKRKTGQKTGRQAGAVVGGVLGGLGGGLIGGTGGGVGRTLLGAGTGALVGGGLGYGMGVLGDEARDSRTRQARSILKMSPKARAELLDTKRARRLEAEDHRDRMERRQMARDVRALRRDSRRDSRRSRIRVRSYSPLVRNRMYRL